MRSAPPQRGRRAAYPIPARLNLCIVAVQISLALAIFGLTSLARTGWHLLALALAFAVVGNSLYSSLHEAEHRILHPRRAVNEGLGVLLGLFFPAPFHLLRQGHLGHHLRNRSDDEAFDFYFEGESPLWKRVQLYSTLTGLFWLVIVLANLVVLVRPQALTRRRFEFDRPTAALVDSLNPAWWRWIRLEAAAVLAFQTLLPWALGIAPLSYLAVYFGFGFTWSAMQYVHHFGTRRDVIEGTRNLGLWAPIDHGWHLTHHRHPTVPWVHLPHLGRAENPRRESMLRHYLRMWRGPRPGTEKVENRYAGRVIR
jgi:fatty acid desaturase